MELDYIKSNLCYYDKRNPNFIKDGIKNETCTCDNCFYGRTELAEEILKLGSM